ncbi:hypothetical protein Tco_0188574 [Tanacetum coccineum]
MGNTCWKSRDRDMDCESQKKNLIAPHPNTFCNPSLVNWNWDEVILIPSDDDEANVNEPIALPVEDADVEIAPHHNPFFNPKLLNWNWDDPSSAATNFCFWKRGRHDKSSSKTRTRDTGHKTHDTEHGTRDTGHGTRDTEHGTRNTEHGTRNTEHGTWNTEHGTRNTEYGTRNTESGTPGPVFRVPCSVSRVPYPFFFLWCIGFRVSGFRFLGPVSGPGPFSVPLGSGVRVPVPFSGFPVSVPGHQGPGGSGGPVDPGPGVPEFLVFLGSVFRVPCSVFRVPCSVFRVPCSVFRVPCSVFRVPCPVSRVPCPVSRVPCPVSRVPCPTKLLGYKLKTIC